MTFYDIVLDIDNTLICSVKNNIPIDPVLFGQFEHFTIASGYTVFKRPGLDAFFTWLKQHYRISIWTAAGNIYADEVLKGIRIPRTYKRLYGEDFYKFGNRKPVLEKEFIRPLLVDNESAEWKYQKKNAYIIGTFNVFARNAKDDKDLFYLQQWLVNKILPRRPLSQPRKK